MKKPAIISVFSLLALSALGMTAFFTDGHPEQGPVLCVFKRFTGIPCPTCGVIRSSTAILHGDFWRGFLINPLGLFLLLSLIFFPIWSAVDTYRDSSSLQRVLKKVDASILRWYYLVPLIILSASNWLWNISKGL